ncbi:hypothetical protein NN561_020219 [Cricetulus griseus]
MSCIARQFRDRVIVDWNTPGRGSFALLCLLPLSSWPLSSAWPSSQPSLLSSSQVESQSGSSILKRQDRLSMERKVKERSTCL